MRVLLAAFLLGLAPVLSAQTFTVTSAEDPGDGVCDADCTLREALLAASAAADGRVAFDAALAGATIALSGTPLTVGSATVDGGALGVSISAGKASRVLEVEAGADVTLVGLTIRDGAVENDLTDVGGGILANPGSTLMLTRCTFQNNEADAWGGAVYSGGDVIVSESVFEQNVAFETGGGLFVTGGLDVKRSTFTSNSAGEGGGVSAYGPLRVETSLFLENWADGGGWRRPLREPRRIRHPQHVLPEPHGRVWGCDRRRRRCDGGAVHP